MVVALSRGDAGDSGRSRDRLSGGDVRRAVGELGDGGRRCAGEPEGFRVPRLEPQACSSVVSLHPSVLSRRGNPELPVTPLRCLAGFGLFL